MSITTEVNSTTARTNPIELLSQLAQEQKSGCVEFNYKLVRWNIYLQKGNLRYVDCSLQLLDQLKYYLHSLGWRQVVNALKQLPQSYLKPVYFPQDSAAKNDFYSQVISWLIAEKQLTPTQGLQLLEYIVKDTLESCLCLQKTNYSWQENQVIPTWIKESFPELPNINLLEYLSQVKLRLVQWQNCSSQLLSVHQRPYFTSGWEYKSLPTSGTLNQKVLQELSNLIRGRTSIRQLSILLQKNELNVAQVLSPYIEEKIIYLRNAQSPLDQLPNIARPEAKPQKSNLNNQKADKKISSKSQVITKKIVCIDDSPTILQEIQRFLDREQFSVTAIDDPIKATSMIFRIKPDLILMDITMPKINGYKLCGLLRSSAYCNQTPIIMVTGNTGLIDKARAKLAGATDYFTKPFTQEGLMKIVEKHLP